MAAHVALTPQKITDAGLESVFVSVIAAGHKFVNNGKTFIRIINGATAMVLTIQTGHSQDGLELADKVVNIGATEEHEIGPFPPGSYNVKTGDDRGMVLLDYDDVTDGTIAVLTL